MKEKDAIAAALVLSFLFCLTGKRAAGDDQATEVAWAPDLGLHSLREINRALHKKEEYPVELVRDKDGEERTVQTCAAYLSAVNDDFFPPDNFQELISLRYVEQCFALQFLQQVSPTAHIGVIRKWPKGMLWLLPPLLCPGECGESPGDSWEAALRNGMPWVKWDPKLRIESINGPDVNLKDWRDLDISLSLVVRSGLRSGEDKPAVQQRFGIVACASVTEGTYHECEFDVLERDGTKFREVYSRP